MSCSKKCPSRAYKVNRDQLLPNVRRRLEFSDDASALDGRRSPNRSSERYENFIKTSINHEAPQERKYTSAEMAAVPDSFLELFQSRIYQESPAAASPAMPMDSPCAGAAGGPATPQDDSIPSSFLEYLLARHPGQQETSSPQSLRSTPRTPSPIVASSRQQRHLPAHGTSFYGGGSFAMPGSEYRHMTFDPTISSSRGHEPPVSPRRNVGGLSPTTGYGGFVYPSIHESQLQYGIGRLAYPKSDSSATPPTPPHLRGATALSPPPSPPPCVDASVMSPIRRRRTPKSRQPVRTTDTSSPPKSAPTSRDVENVYSTSSIYGQSRRLTAHKSDTVCSDDFLQSGSPGSCPRCPTLGVTPVQSSASLGSTPGANAPSEENRQNISNTIEQELFNREAQERSQLEADLLRWQRARRKLVMNTANMGS